MTDPRRLKVAFHWSGGKDSMLALSRLVSDADVDVDRLLTTVHPARGASTVHGLPVELLEAQADRLGLPLKLVAMPGAALDGYDTVMAELATQLADEGVAAVAFGDLSCSGVRDAKVAQFAPYGIDVLELARIAEALDLDPARLAAQIFDSLPSPAAKRSKPKR